MKAHYYPGVFDVASEDHAKRIILTNEGPGADTETRWKVETPYLADLIGQTCAPTANSVLLDYGCGIGRLAKEAIARHGCAVIGVDASASMRDLARNHVGSDRFLSASPAQFDIMVDAGLRVDGFICVWVLQHCTEPAKEVGRINRALRPGGAGFVLNMRSRAIPAVIEDGAKSFRWVSDAADVRAILGNTFTVTRDETPDPAKVPHSDSYWLALQRHAP